MLVLLLSAALLVPHVIAQSCHYQRCIGCKPEQAAGSGTVTECYTGNWVSAQWIHNYGYPPPSTGSKIPIEYRCLKMVATPDDKSFGNTVDIIRGCVPRMQVDSVCLGLVAVERARGHSDARCHICHGNNCNSVARIQTEPLHITLLLPLMYFILR